MIILDTNVLSEGMRAHPNVAVQRWLDRQTERDLYICAPVLAEIWFGVALLPPGRQRDAITHAAERIEKELYRDRILPFDSAAASIYGRIAAERRQQGAPLDAIDGMIAAITMANAGAALSTRNVRDFAGLGLALINPFEFRD